MLEAFSRTTFPCPGILDWFHPGALDEPDTDPDFDEDNIPEDEDN